MHWVEVSGYPLPQRYAGHPALELCNTWAGWQDAVWTGGDHAPGHEWLRDYDRFAVWAGYVGLLDESSVTWLRRRAAEEPAAAESGLNQARQVRTALYRVLTGPPDAEAFGVVAATARAAMAASELVDEQRGAQRVARWRIPTVGLEQPALAAAFAAAELLCGPDRAKVRACPGGDCGWLFIDQRGRRRWCSMESCGNRAKVRSHAARQRGTAPAQ
ncbi:MAG: CGNR zinc finger domain-containing protein [Micromonosporaceae bacterium]